MQPVYYNSFLIALPWIAGFVLLGLVGVGIAYGSPRKRNTVGGPLVAVVALVGFVISAPIVGLSTQTNEREERIAEVEKVYGLDISPRDFYALDYPGNLPEEDLQSFGTAAITTEQENGELVRNHLTLVWQDGEFRLFQGEGAITTLDELPRSSR